MDYYGQPVRRYSSSHLSVDVLAESGPRLVRLMVASSAENLLAETPDVFWTTPGGRYNTWGGHRLWHAPEFSPRTYIPDDGGLTLDELSDGVRLIGPIEALTGIRKSLEIHLHPDRPVLTLAHCLRNEGAWPVELAPWGITQLPLGGVAILPQPQGDVDGNPFAPNRRFAFWPYTHFDDPRLEWHDDVVLVRGLPLGNEAAPSPFKIGYFNTHGWAAYLRNGTMLVKRFIPQPDLPLVDFGCNVEVYANFRFFELETLGPLQRLAPGSEINHSETWEIRTGLEKEMTIEAVRTLVAEVPIP